MFHPLGVDLSAISDDDLYKKHAELNKRYTQAYRSGPHSIIPQLQMLMADYANEIQNRNKKKMEEMLRKADKDGKTLSDIIDIQ
jgi:hypothetical protein